MVFLFFSHMASLVRQLRLDGAFAARPDQTTRRFTLIVPTNAAWEKAQLDFSKAYNTLVEGQFPNYVSTTLPGVGCVSCVANYNATKQHILFVLFFMSPLSCQTATFLPLFKSINVLLLLMKFSEKMLQSSSNLY